MTPTTVSSLTQAPPLFSNTNSTPSPQVEKAAALQPVATDAPKGSPVPVDIVSLSAQSKLVISDIKKEELLNEAAKKKKDKEESLNSQKRQNNPAV